MDIYKHCAQCGESFRYCSRTNRRYCSKECAHKIVVTKARIKARKDHSPLPTKKICIECGEEFIASKFVRSVRVYCSSICIKRAMVRKRREKNQLDALRCRACDKIIIGAKRSDRKFCDDRCTQRYHAPSIIRTFTCVVCGALVTSSMKSAYCSHKCGRIFNEAMHILRDKRSGILRSLSREEIPVSLTLLQAAHKKVRRLVKEGGLHNKNV